ncbi:MAG: chromate transporter [Microgenomates group bacterium]|nr:chromate transporter [Microgenomates group bacterium]
MVQKTEADLKSSLKSLEETLNLYFGKKAPALPTNIKELIVNLAPYLAILGVILSIPAILAILGIGAAFAPWGMMGGWATGRIFWGTGYYINMAFLIVIVILQALSISGLMKRTKAGWNYMFYASLVGVLQNLILFNLGGLIIGGAISFYCLFQVREYYK